MLAMGRYLGRCHAAAENDGVLGTELIRVIDMLDEPSRLFAPDLVEVTASLLWTTTWSTAA
jgi:hypothetical protein